MKPFHMVVRGNVSAEKSRSVVGELPCSHMKARSCWVIHPNFTGLFTVRFPFEFHSELLLIIECQQELLRIMLRHIEIGWEGGQTAAQDDAPRLAQPLSLLGSDGWTLSSDGWTLS